MAEVLVEYEWGDRSVLECLGDIQAVLDGWGIESTPPIGEGGLEDVRIFRLVSADVSQQTLADLNAGEGSSLEFKQTLMLDVDKHQIGNKPIAECYSEKMIMSCVKTVAAYLNTNGGTLLIGVADDGSCNGIEREFCLIPGAKKRDFDEWELYFRSLIEKYFYRGRSLSASVRITPVRIEQMLLARVEVGSRREVCVTKAGEGDIIYIRAGNRTLSIGLPDIEQYFELKKLYI